eukprot:4659062-Prymnesium_polylepis.1
MLLRNRKTRLAAHPPTPSLASEQPTSPPLCDPTFWARGSRVLYNLLISTVSGELSTRNGHTFRFFARVSNSILFYTLDDYLDSTHPLATARIKYARAAQQRHSRSRTVLQPLIQAAPYLLCGSCRIPV